MPDETFFFLHHSKIVYFFFLDLKSVSPFNKPQHKTPLSELLGPYRVFHRQNINLPCVGFAHPPYKVRVKYLPPVPSGWSSVLATLKLSISSTRWKYKYLCLSWNR